MNSMIWENRDPFKKNKREALIKKMVLKRLGDEIRPISYQQLVFFHEFGTFIQDVTKTLSKQGYLLERNVENYDFGAKR